MNIQKLEVVLDEMPATSFADTASAEALVRKWAAQIGDAITEHLIADLDGANGPAEAIALDLYPEPGELDWGQST